MNTITNPKDGTCIDRRMSDHAAAEICTKLDDSFAQSLGTQFPALSECQLYWMHRKAYESLDGPKDTTFPLQEGAHRKLQQLFTRAASVLQFPKLRYDTPDGVVRITIRHGGKIAVHCGHTFCGHITEQDLFEFTHSCPESVKNVLQIVSKSPILAAIAWGHKIGHCCFCGLELTDARSVSMGYGPICADKWGLPWGEVTDAESLLELIELIENPRPVSGGEPSK